jgi:hypothetical protein
MNKIVAACLALSLISFACASPSPISTATASTATDQPPPDPPASEYDDRSIYRAGLVPSAQPVLDGLAGASVYHLDIHLADDLLSLTGTLDVRYTNT